MNSATLGEADIDSDMTAIKQEILVLAAALMPPVAEVIPADLLARLEAHLQDRDAAAAILFKENGAALRVALGPECDALAEQVGQFDFSDALKTLRTLRTLRQTAQP